MVISSRGVAVMLAPLLALTAQAQHPAPQTDVERLDGIVKESRFAAKKLDNPKQPVWTIKRKGENLKEFEVIFIVKNGVLVTFVTVAPKASLKRTPELLEKMLKMNYQYDT